MKGLPPNIPISLLVPEYEDGPVLKPPNPNIQGAMYSPVELEEEEVEPGKKLTKLNYKHEIEKRALGLTGIPFGDPPSAQSRFDRLGESITRKESLKSLYKKAFGMQISAVPGNEGAIAGQSEHGDENREASFHTGFGGPDNIESEESWPPGNIERRDTDKTINISTKTEPGSIFEFFETGKLTRTREPRMTEAMSTETKELLKLSEALGRSGYKAQANYINKLATAPTTLQTFHAATNALRALQAKVLSTAKQWPERTGPNAVGEGWGPGDDEVNANNFNQWIRAYTDGKFSARAPAQTTWNQSDTSEIVGKIRGMVAVNPSYQAQFLAVVSGKLKAYSGAMAAHMAAKSGGSSNAATGGGRRSSFAYPVSDCVKQIQGILGVTVDGKFGPNTKAAWTTKTSAVALPATCALALAALQPGDSGATGGSAAGTEVDTQLLIKYLAYPGSLVHRATLLVPTYQAASLAVLDNGALSCEDAAGVVASSMRNTVEAAFGEDADANSRLIDTLSIMPLCSPEDMVDSNEPTEQEGNLVLYQGPIQSPISEGSNLHSIGLAKRSVDADGDGDPDYEDMIPVFVHGGRLLPIEMRPSALGEDYPGYLTTAEQHALAGRAGSRGRFLGIPLPGRRNKAKRERGRELAGMRDVIRHHRRAND